MKQRLFKYLLFILLLTCICCNNKEISNSVKFINYDSLAIEYHTDKEYSNFLGGYMVPRENNVFFYYNQKDDILIYFERINYKILISDDWEREIDVKLKKQYPGNYKEKKYEIIEKINLLCDKMNKYHIYSFWGIPDSNSLRQLSITFNNNRNVLYYKKPTAEIGSQIPANFDTLLIDNDWILFKD